MSKEQEKLKNLIKHGMPLTSHRAAWQWVKTKYPGIRQKDVSAYLNAHRAYRKKLAKKDETLNRYTSKVIVH
jgi:hypothetical protein